MLRRLNQSGDTIIEVLVAVTIIGAILTGGYVITNFSLTTERQSQERNIAVGILQGQVEQLRANIPTNNNFCMVDDVAMNVGGTTCNFDVNGNNNASASATPLYKINITNCHNASSCNTGYLYTATATWEALGGGVDKVSLITYRLD